MKERSEGERPHGELTSQQAGRPNQTEAPHEAGERVHCLERRQFLKGAVEMAAGGLLIFESAQHVTEGVLREMQRRIEARRELKEQGLTKPIGEGSSKLRYGLDVVKAGIAWDLMSIGFDRINSPKSSHGDNQEEPCDIT